MKNRLRAFTLIELLVVIAIIAILAAILFPVFAQAKAAAKKTASLSNIKQNDLGVIMYNADVDDMMPRALSQGGFPVSPTPASDFVTTPAQADDINGYWASSVQPYVKNWDLYKDASGKDLNPYNYPARAKRYAYSFNAYLNLYSATGVTSPALAISFWMGVGGQNFAGYAHSFPQPNSKTGYPTTNDYMFQRSGATCTTYGGLNLGSGQTTSAWDYRVYGNTSLMAYVDGHAKSVNVKSPDYPWILDDKTGKPTSLWVNTTDSAAGCTYFSVLAPTRE